MTTLVWEATVTDVKQKEITVGGRKSVDGSAELFMEKIGWYIYFGHVAVFAGGEKPDFDKGDRVKITFIKMERKNASEETNS
jgi:hypothetical protein